MQGELSDHRIAVWKEPPRFWLALAVVAMLLALVFRPGIADLIRVWSVSEEYGYGFAVPLISAFLIWQRKDLLERAPFTGGWWGVALAAAGIVLLVIARMSSVMLLSQLAFLVTLTGTALALTGAGAFRIICVPLLMLVFMIPLPLFMLNEISYTLQLISSRLGVWLMRIFDISVFLEGNVIDLGAYKLQVAEACSGLRYLFPLMTLGFIAAYFFRGAWWQRALIFISTVPIAVLMNSLRIGAIGITVEYWGIAMADGLLHDLEGWVVFMLCIAILVGEMWLLARCGSTRLPLREAFGLEFPALTPDNARRQSRDLPRPYLALIALLGCVAVAAVAIPERVQTVPPRTALAEFPLQLGEWSGKRDRLDSVYLDILQMDDYVIVDYVDAARQRVNLFVAFYRDQLQGGIHSPRACVPAGGWSIDSLEQTTVPGAMAADGTPLTVNRALIRKGDATQLVYYWFQQRGRSLAQEYQVKWFIFVDSIQRSRSDGALVRLVTAVAPGEAPAQADRRLADFAAAAMPRLPAHVPD